MTDKPPCKKHPTYTAIARPESGCQWCWQYWNFHNKRRRGVTKGKAIPARTVTYLEHVADEAEGWEDRDEWNP